MRGFLAGLLLTLPFVASSTQAASLMLGCTGTLTDTQVPKDKFTPDPTTTDIADFSVVVDFDRRSVLGFWTHKKHGTHHPLPITAIDANSVTFTSSRKLDGGLREDISGTIDRITGKLDAHETLLWRPGTMRTFTWDLQCNPK